MTLGIYIGIAVVLVLVAVIYCSMMYLGKSLDEPTERVCPKHGTTYTEECPDCALEAHVDRQGRGPKCLN